MWRCTGYRCCSIGISTNEPVFNGVNVSYRLTEVPISAYIPYWLLLGILLFSSLLCIVASVISVHFIVNQPIAFTAKGGRRCVVC